MKITEPFAFAPGTEQYQTPNLAAPSIDEQIASAKNRHARMLEELARDYAQRRQRLTEDFAKEMHALALEKAAQQANAAP